jgi:CHAT domain-containing protein
MKPLTGKELNELVRKFREPMEIIPGKDTIRDKLKSFDLRTGKKISDILLADVLPNLPAGAALTIVPDDCLGTLPFEMLPLNDGGEIVDDGNKVSVKGVNFLGDRNRISYCQSLTALTLARILGNKASPRNNLLVVADPVFHTLDARAIIGEQATRFAKSDERFNSALMDAIEATSMGSFKLERLPLTGDLAEGLAAVFDQDATLFTGMNASKAKLLEDMGKELGNYGNLVFATHGFFSPDSPVFQEPILFLTLVPLGTDGFLRMSEVMGLNICANTVALTACQTGLGKRISGEGTMGMGRAFQYAGAKSALMSLWSVSEKASVKLVQLFFENIREGMTKTEALDKARKQIRSEGFDHPFYWAAFIMFGENT